MCNSLYRPQWLKVKADPTHNKDYQLLSIQVSPFVAAPLLKDDDIRRFSRLSFVPGWALQRLHFCCGL